MAVFKERCGGYELKINDVDHEPPHCHVSVKGRNIRRDLVSLAVMNPPPHDVAPVLRRCLRSRQERMLEAWDKVTLLP